MTYARTLWLALPALLLAGCTINPPLQLAPLVAADTAQLRGVPFFPQTEYECGPAALAGVLGASGVAATAQSLSPQVYLPGRQGSLQVELVAAVRRAACRFELLLLGRGCCRMPPQLRMRLLVLLLHTVGAIILTG